LIQNKHQQAEIRARLAKAKTVREALIILKTSSKKGRMGMYDIVQLAYLDCICPDLAMLSPDVLMKEHQDILTVAQQLNSGI